MKIKAVLSAALLLGVCSSDGFAFTIADCPHYTTSFVNGICYPSKVAPLAVLDGDVLTAETNLAAAKKLREVGKMAFAEAAAKKKLEKAGAAAGVTPRGGSFGTNMTKSLCEKDPNCTYSTPKNIKTCTCKRAGKPDEVLHD